MSYPFTPMPSLNRLIVDALNNADGWQRKFHANQSEDRNITYLINNNGDVVRIPDVDNPKLPLSPSKTRYLCLILGLDIKDYGFNLEDFGT